MIQVNFRLDRGIHFIWRMHDLNNLCNGQWNNLCFMSPILQYYRIRNCRHWQVPCIDSVVLDDFISWCCTPLIWFRQYTMHKICWCGRGTIGYKPEGLSQLKTRVLYQSIFHISLKAGFSAKALGQILSYNITMRTLCSGWNFYCWIMIAFHCEHKWLIWIIHA